MSWIPQRRSQWVTLWQTREDRLFTWWEWRGKRYRMKGKDYRDTPRGRHGG